MKNKLRDIINELEKHNKDFAFKENRTLFETLGVLSKEIRHSNMIYWLLNIFQDKQQYTLLNFLMKKLKYDKFTKNKKPIRINTEEPANSRNVDIYIEWDDFILLIENKIHSSEQKNQCSDYLQYFQENNKEKKQVKIIYLTQTGKRPPSIKSQSEQDKDLECLSYQELIHYFEQFHFEIEKEKNNKNKKSNIILNDYIISCRKLLGIGVPIMAEKLKIKESSELLFKYHDQLYESTKNDKIDTYFTQALEDSNNLIEYIHQELTKKFKDLELIERKTELPEMTKVRHYFWSKDEWIKTFDKDNKTFYFGFSYHAASINSNRLFPYLEHPVGLWVPSKDAHKNFTSQDGQRRKNLAQNLHLILRDINKKLIMQKEYRSRSSWNGWIANTELDTQLIGSNDPKYNTSKKWADQLIKKSCEMAKKMIPTIDENLNDIWKI